MNRWHLWSLTLPLLAAGCTCGAVDPATRFACSTSDDCGAGYVCSSVQGSLECVLADAGSAGGGTATGGGTGGGSALGGGGGGSLGGGGGSLGGGGGSLGGGGGSVGGGGGSLGGGGGSLGGGGGSLGGGGGSLGGGGGSLGGGGGSLGGGGGATGGGAGAPDHLAFTTNAQVLYAAVCSSALTVELRNPSNQPASLPGSTTVTYAGPITLAFYRDAACTLSTNSAVIPAGATSVTVYFRSTVASSPAIAASSPPLMAASQIETVLPTPTSLVFTSPVPAAPILPGLCFPATVEARSSFGTVPAVLIADSPVALTATPVGGLRFYSNATCTTPITGVTITAGQSSKGFFVKTVSGSTNTITATATFGTATQSFTVVGIVRQGTCNMANGQLTITCAVSPMHQSMAKTVLFFQSTSSSSNPLDSEVRCRLVTPDLVACQRIAAGPAPTPVNINWQTAELATGLTVQRSSGMCTVGAGSVPLATAVNPTSTFVLASFTGIGTNFDDDDMDSARLVDAGTVLLEPEQGQVCTNYDFQVVEWAGVTVSRGVAGGLGIGARQVGVLGLPAASTNTVLFNQALTGSPVALPTGTSMCNLLVRSAMPSTTSLLFSRGGDNPNSAACENVPLAQLPWERVDFGTRARVQAFTATLTGNSTDVTISSVDTTRTVVFSGGQMAGGQATGETAVDNSGDDAVGPGLARFELINDITVRVTRGRNQSSGTFTFYVMEIEP